MLFNKDGWPMIAPVRYAGEKVEEISYGDIQGAYQIIEDQPAIRPDIIKSQEIKIDKKNINGDYTGSIELTDEGHATMELNEEQIQGQFLVQWDEYSNKQTLTFTGLSSSGRTYMMIRK